MKYNNGDMDDLFRRASEGYPLRTDSADWERLASALDSEPASPSDQEKRRRRRGVFWWFVLIPLAGVGYLTWQVRAHHSSERGIVVAPGVAAPGGADSRDAGGTAAPGGAGGSVAPGGGGVATVRSGKIGEPATGSAVGAERAASVVGGAEVRKVRTRDAGGANAGDVRGTRGGEESVSEGGKVRNMRTRNAGGTGSAGSSGTGSSGTGSSGTGSTGTGSAGTAMSATGRRATGNGGDEGHDPALALLDLRRAPIGGGYHVDVNVVAPKAAADGTAPAAKNQTKKNSHGYIGVLGAPDFSTVHFQSMKGVGTTFGVLLGYSFNDRWAVETGLLLDRKRYYTAGEYFKVEMPSNYTLLNVDGTCYMWEIPVNVRYNFNTSPRMKWFATAGLSTYLMSRENYTYQYEYNWVRTSGTWDIHKPSQYWFSIVNLSAGFEQRIGKIGNLRLEPYVRIPLSGIGTGNLPIMSAGLNIGLTRQLW
jgi:hypothetical protein